MLAVFSILCAQSFGNKERSVREESLAAELVILIVKIHASKKKKVDSISTCSVKAMHVLVDHIILFSN